MPAILNKIRARRIFTILMTLLALVILGGTIYANRASLLAVRWELHPLLLVGSFLTYALCVTVAALNWGFMMRVFGSPASWRQHITIYTMALLMSRLPIPLGYVAGRLLFYDKETSRVTISFASALELALILLAAVGLSLFFWPQTGSNLDWRIAVPVLLLCLVAIHPRVLNRLLSLLKVRQAYPLRYSHTVGWLAACLIIWILGGIALYLMISAIYPLPLSRLALVIGAWSLSNLATILMAFLPVGLGLRELAFGGLLALFLPPGISALAAILSRVIMTLYEAVLAGIAYLFREKPPAKDENLVPINRE